MLGRVMQTKTPEAGWARADVLRLHRRRCADAARGSTCTSRGHVPPRTWIVLGHTPWVGHDRLHPRAPGERSLPLSLCPLDDEPCLVEQLVRLSERLGASDVDLVVEPEVAPQLPASLRHRVDPISAPAHVGTGVGLLVPLVRALVRDPGCTVVIAPHDIGWLVSRGLEHAIARAQARAEATGAIVLLGAEVGALTPWLPAHPGRSWLVPFGPRGRATDVPIARVVARPRGRGAPPSTAVDALHPTGFVVAPAMRLLDLFEDLTPRLVRLFLFGASMPTDEGDDFMRRALEDLGPLDLLSDLLAFARCLRAIVVPESAGLSDLRGELAAAVWLARRRSVAEHSTSPYRRVSGSARGALTRGATPSRARAARGEGGPGDGSSARGARSRQPPRSRAMSGR